MLIAVNALGRGLLAPGRAAWRLVPISDRSAGILYRLAMTFAAIWAVERLVEPAADAAASLNIAVADTGRRRDCRRDRDRLCDAPARGAADGRAGIAAKRGLGPLENARLGGRVDHFPGRGDRLRRLRHVPHQPGDLPQHRRRRPLHRRYHRPGRNRSRLQAGWADWIAPPGHGGTAPQRARADLRHPAGRRPRGGGDARLRGGAEAMGRAVAGHVRRAALGLFRLLVRRRHPVAVVVDRRGDRLRRCRLLHPARSRIGSARDSCRRRASTLACEIQFRRFSAISASSSLRCWPARRSASTFRNSR